MMKFQIDELLNAGSGVLLEVKDTGDFFYRYGVAPAELAEAIMAFIRPRMRHLNSEGCYALFDKKCETTNRRAGISKISFGHGEKSVDI
jgi:hypothetical protein